MSNSMKNEQENNPDNEEKSNKKCSVIETWEDPELDLKNELLRGIYAYGFEKPSSIQKKAVMPFIYGINGKRRDIIAQGQSGTGKTGAFSISSLQILDELL